MRLTEADKKMFSSLRDSSTGKSLVEFIERLQADICDIRKFGLNDSVESAQQASKRLDEFKKLLKNSVGTSKIDPNQFH